MRKNTIILVLALSTLVLFVLCMIQQRRIGRLMSEDVAVVSDAVQISEESTIAQLRDQLEQQQSLAEEAQMKYEEDVNQLNAQLEQHVQNADTDRDTYEKTIRQLTSRLETAQSNQEAADTDQARETEKPASTSDDKPFFSKLAKTLKDPEMKKMIQSQQKAMMDISYSSLYGLLDLPAEDLATFKDLLARKQMENMDIGLDLMDDTLTPEDREEMKKQMEEITTQIDKEIEELLGPENNATFKAYEESQPERMQVGFFKQALGPELELNETQENDLIWALHEKRSSFEFTSGLENQQAMDPSQITPESMATFFEENARLHEQYIEASSEILTPGQLDQLKASLEQQRSMQQMGMKMMFGSSNAEAGPTESNSE